MSSFYLFCLKRRYKSKKVDIEMIFYLKNQGIQKCEKEYEIKELQSKLKKLTLEENKCRARINMLLKQVEDLKKED